MEAACYEHVDPALAENLAWYMRGAVPIMVQFLRAVLVHRPTDLLYFMEEWVSNERFHGMLDRFLQSKRARLAASSEHVAMQRQVSVGERRKKPSSRSAQEEEEA